MPHRWKRSLLGLLLLASLVGGGLVGSNSASASTVTSAQASFTGYGGDWVGGSRSWYYSTDDGTRFTASKGNTNAIDISWFGTTFWTLNLEAPQGEALAPGTYSGATRAAGTFWAPYRPGLDLGGDGRGCNTLTGNFTINHIAFDAGLNLTALDVDFTQHCEGLPSYTQGRVVVNMPVSAPPAAGTAGVTSARSVDQQRGKLRMAAKAPAGVTSLTAHLLSPITGAEVASTSAFTLESGTANDGTWVTDAPFSLPALGMYRVDTELVDGNGTHTTQTNVGYLAYERLSGLVSMAVNPPSPTSVQPTVTISGKLQATEPASSVVSAIGGATIRLFTDQTPRWGDEQFVSVTTQPDGTFSIPMTFSHSGYLLVEHLGDRATHTAGTTKTLDIGASSTITVNVDHALINPGDPLTISGVVTKNAGGGWEPDPGAQVKIENCPADLGYCGGELSTVTDASGHYSLTTEWYSTGKIQVSAVSADPFVLNPIAQTPIRVRTPAKIDSFSGVWLTGKTARFTGQISFDHEQPPSPVPVRLEYRWWRSSSWTTIATVNATWNGTAWTFSADVAVTDIGQWRVTTTQLTYYLPATSGSLWTICNCRQTAPRRTP